MRPTVRLLPLLAIVGACATGGATTGSAPQGDAIIIQNTQNIIQTGGANSINLGSGTTTIIQASATQVNFTADKVFAALAGVYESLSIPVTTMVTKDRMLGNLELKARARLGSIPMRRILDCGSQMGDPNADLFQIIMSVSSEVRDNGDGSSTLSTVVQATGRPVQFAGNDVRCSPTGELENRIANALKLKLGEQR